MYFFFLPGYFGSFEWSSSDGHICYVAEKKLPKTASYFGKKSDSDETKKDETVKVCKTKLRFTLEKICASFMRPACTSKQISIDLI